MLSKLKISYTAGKFITQRVYLSGFLSAYRGFMLGFFDSIVTFSFFNASLAHLTHAIFPILFHVNQITHQLCNAISVQRAFY